MRVVCLVAMVGCSVPEQGWPLLKDTASHVAVTQGSVRGTVTGVTGPLASAYVTTDPLGYSAITGADGAFEMGRLAPGDYELTIAAPGYDTNVVAATIELGSASEVDVELGVAVSDEGWVEVVVAGPTGDPYEGATLNAPTGARAVTDAEGYARLPVRPGSATTLTVEADDVHGRSLSIDMPTFGNLQFDLQLSGRPAADATYLGSTTCGGCHIDRLAAVLETGHGQAASESLTGDLGHAFVDDTTVSLPGGSARLHEIDEEAVVTIIPNIGASIDLPVLGVLGRQDTGTVPWTELFGQAYALPIAWVGEDPSRAGYPGAEAGFVPFQVETWLESGAIAFDQRPSPALSAESNCFGCHTTGFELEPQTDGGAIMTGSLGSGRYASDHVGCERCHGPGSSHVAAPTDAERPWFITRPDRLDPKRTNEVCAQCHSSVRGHGTALPYPVDSDGNSWLPGDTLADFAVSEPDHWLSGAAAAPNQQADERALSPHETNGVYSVRCIDCHDPHGEAVDGDGEPHPNLLRAGSADNGLCTSCHDYGADHTGHAAYGPSGVTEAGRCVGCHMPKTAARLRWDPDSGAGDLSSHLFEARPPSDTLQVFDDAGVTRMDVGTFPTHACADCHAYNAALSGAFSGPTGDPELRSTHAEFDAAFQVMFP